MHHMEGDAGGTNIGGPPRQCGSEIAGELRSIGGVTETHHLHARMISDRLKTFSGHLVIADQAQSAAVLAEAKEIVDRRQGFSLSTIQIEEPGLAGSEEPGLEAKA